MVVEAAAPHSVTLYNCTAHLETGAGPGGGGALL